MSRSRSWFFGFGALLLGSLGGACHDSSGAPLGSRSPLQSAAGSPSEGPLRPVTEQNAVPGASVAPPAPASPASAAPPAVPLASAAPSASPLSNPEADQAPPLLDATGKALPQTEQRPTLSSALFQQRISALARAIISADAEPAYAAFFPLVAYQQVKDVAKPERDYKFRLLANFKRDVLEYHHALGASAAQAKFEGVTVSEKDAKWMAPGSEGNKLGYFRVLRSRLRFTLPTGRSREFELTSMISWRGEWYVVHLHGFK